ncbi:MAG: insulinase family protein [Proteobacteria bacterium]|nr:MAG: insulinase family protein [Pseudomonadota bacterium]
MELHAMHSRLLPSALFLALYLLYLPVCSGDNVIKSQNDQRQYESFLLSNRLKVLVISDPDTDKAAAAMDVFVGSSRDPKDRQGLAHFLEHMLFLGTKKYPTPGEYQDFVSTRGGNHNAYTAFEHTNYFFDIDKDYLEPALDRFAQFFIAPLFTPEYVDREKNAVHSEYQSRKKDDDTRLHQVWKRVANPGHPFSNFNVGNLDTLSDRKGAKVRDELVDFYSRHYSANIMTLVVLGREPNAVLRQWVTKKFSAIKNVDAKPLHITEPIFAEGRLPARVNVIPLKDRQIIRLTFPIPALFEFYRSKPVHYIANLLGHEAEGSLLSLLKKKGWVDSLSAGSQMSNRSSATLDVSMRLTKKGVPYINDIASHVFQYLRLIEKRGIKQWIFDEQKRISEIDFRFQEKPAPISYVRSLASNLQIYPASDVLYGPYAMDKYDPTLIRYFLARLTPDNVLVTVNAKDLQTNMQDPWFDTAYQVTGLGSDIIERLQNDEPDPLLAIPKRNVFLPTDLSVKLPKEVTSKPIQLKKSRGFELWFQQDNTFRVPRADFYFSIRSKSANDSPEHAVLTQLYVKIVNDQLNEFSYPAYLAGLTYDLYKHLRGFTVRISGYNDKQALLLSHIVEALTSPIIKPERFAIAKDELGRRLRNERREPPHRQTVSEVSRLLLKPHWTGERRLTAMQRLTVKDLEEFIPKLLSRIEVVILAHGNLYRRDALDLAKVLEEKLISKSTPISVPPGQVVKLPGAKQYVRQLEIDHPDSAITIYVQGANRSYTTKAMVSLTAQVLSSPFYNDLRTDKQLGYIVFATSMPLLEVPGMVFIVQSPITDPIELETHIERFLLDYYESVARMSETDFEKHRQGLLARILEKDKRLRTRSNRYWTELDRENYNFDSRRQLADAVRLITKDEFVKFYKRFLLSENRKRIVARSTGDQHKMEFAEKERAQKYIVIRDPDSFKEGKKYFPRYDDTP